MTVYPSPCSIGMILCQLLPSANAPWARTIVGFAESPTADATLRRKTDAIVRGTNASVFMRLPPSRPVSDSFGCDSQIYCTTGVKTNLLDDGIGRFLGIRRA